MIDEIKNDKNLDNNSFRHNKLNVVLPGVFIEIKIYVPNTPMFNVWATAFLETINKGKPLKQLINDPPWPRDKKLFWVSEYLLFYLIDNEYLGINWSDSKLLFNKPIENNLFLNNSEYREIKLELWINLINGQPLPINYVYKYDFEFTKEYKNLIKLPPNDPIKIIEKTFLTDQRLFREIRSQLSFEEIKSKTILFSPKINIKEEKEIVIPLTYNQQFGYLLPSELKDLEELLKEQLPQYFEQKIHIRKQLPPFVISKIEKFSYHLANLNVSNIIGEPLELLKEKVAILQEIVESKDDFLDWLKNGYELELIGGTPDKFFNLLAEIISENTSNISSSETSWILILTSFLSPKLIHSSLGIGRAIKEMGSNSKIILIYGHPTDSSIGTLEKELENYVKTLIKVTKIPEKQIIPIVSNVKTHEKVILSSNANFLISSWNPGSSNPDSTVFEVGITGKDPSLSLKLLEILKPLFPRTHQSLYDTLKETLLHKNKVAQQSNKPLIKKYEEQYMLLFSSVEEFSRYINNSSKFDHEFLEKYKHHLHKIYSFFYPFILKSRIQFIDKELTRKIIVRQINHCKSKLFLATDRLSKSGFDFDLILQIKEKNLKTFLLHDREWELDSSVQAKDRKSELSSLINTIRKNIDTLITSPAPMENHGKFAIFDNQRLLITSSNFLNYGGEIKASDSRELGIFIENPVLSHHLFGLAIQHRPNYFNDRTLEVSLHFLLAYGIDLFYAFKELDEKNPLGYDYKETKYILSGIELDINEKLKELGKKLKQSKENKSLQFDLELVKHELELYEKINKLHGIDKPTFFYEMGRKYFMIIPNEQNKFIPYIEKSEIENTIQRIKRPESLRKNENTASFPKKQKIIEKSLNTGSGTRPTSSNIEKIIEEIFKNMVEISPGTFKMGENLPLNLRKKIINNKNKSFPVHEVKLTKKFMISRFITTQKTWKAIMGELPYLLKSKKKFIGPKKPIIFISYLDIMKFIEKLNNYNAYEFSLPTEAQWEYSCRAGTDAKYFFGDDDNLLDDYAWSKINSGGRLHEVGMKKPNPWGLYDMIGLAYESVLDDLRVYSSNKVVDPIGPLNSNECGARGGAWSRHPSFNNPIKNHFSCGHREFHKKTEKSYRASFRIIIKL